MEIPIQNTTLDIVGSSNFGRTYKISANRTYNMIMSDGFLIDYMGYEKAITTTANGTGRGLFPSLRSNSFISSIGNNIFRHTLESTNFNNQSFYSTFPIGEISSYSGDVFIDENNNNQIAICDQHKLYIYNHVSGSFTQATLPEGFQPGYVTYQNGYFITIDRQSSVWALSAPGDGLNWFWGDSGQPVLGALQTKPDYGRAVLRVPGRGNLLFVMGETVTEQWTDIGKPLFPYQISYGSNIDYGCINPATIAALDNIVAWVGINEKAGPVLMYTTGADIQQISTDGINYKLSTLNYPSYCSAFFIKLAGHLIYQVNFYKDNYSFIYDFNTKSFFDVTDENMNYHIARKAIFFQGDYYFVSFNDNSIYRFSADLYDFNYGTYRKEIPRIRICSNIRLPNSDKFCVNNISLTLQQGNDNFNIGNDSSYNPRIGLSISKDGGITYGSYDVKNLNMLANRINRMQWWKKGMANDFVCQFRFWGKGPWDITNSTISLLL